MFTCASILSHEGSLPSCTVMYNLPVMSLAFKLFPHDFIQCLLWSGKRHFTFHFNMFNTHNPNSFIPSLHKPKLTLHWCDQFHVCFSGSHLLGHLSQWHGTSTSPSFFQYASLFFAIMVMTMTIIKVFVLVSEVTMISPEDLRHDSPLHSWNVACRGLRTQSRERLG